MNDIKILPIMYVPHTYHLNGLNSFGDNLKDENGQISESINSKLSLLHEVFKSIKDSDRYKNFFKKHTNHSLAIITLPEYFFNLNSYPCCETELEEVLSGIASIIPNNEKILFVAGTIPWYRIENGTIKIYICAPVYYERKLIFATSKLKTANDHLLSKSQKARNEISGYLDSWGFSVKSSNSMLKIEQDTSDSRKLRFQKLVDFNKDFCEKFKLNNIDFIKLKIGDKELKIGIEICADQCFGRLILNKDVPELDIHIVIACGTSYKKSSIMARKGGYIIVCDGSAGYEIGVLKCISKITLKESRKYNQKLDSLRIQLEDKRVAKKIELDSDKKKKLQEEFNQLKLELDDYKDKIREQFDSLDFESDTDKYVKKSISEVIFDAQCELRFKKPKFFNPITLKEVEPIKKTFSLLDLFSKKPQ